MKVSELAKKHGMKPKEMVKFINSCGIEEITHYMNKMDDNQVSLVESKLTNHNAELRDAFTINQLPTEFSVIKLVYSGGDFGKKLSGIATDLNCSVEDLNKALKKHGYPTVASEIKRNFNQKSKAVVEYRNQIYKSNLLLPEKLEV